MRTYPRYQKRMEPLQASYQQHQADVTRNRDMERQGKLDVRRGVMPLTKDRITRVAHALAITRPDDSNGVWYATCQDVADGLGLDSSERARFIADCRGSNTPAHPPVSSSSSIDSPDLSSWENERGLYV
jgi:hypothetical protein